jgi:hypothetical protein
MAKLLVNFYQWEIEKTKGLQSLNCKPLAYMVRHTKITLSIKLEYL